MSDGKDSRFPHENLVPKASHVGDEWRIELPCYEGPEGKGPGTLDLGEAALCRHVLALGATGSGKTSFLRSLTRRLIAAHPDDPARRPGLVIFDFKCDDTVAHIFDAAAAVGRTKDVRVLSLESDTAYDFFGECRRLGDANEFAERLQFGCAPMLGGHDVFWHEFRHSLLSAAVTWLTSVRGRKRDFAGWVAHASSWLLSERLTDEHRAELQTLRENAAAHPAGTAPRIALDHAVQLIEEWDGTLDHRTRSNARATLQNALRPLLEEPVLHLFRSRSRKKFNVLNAFEKAQILVVSIPAFRHPELASLIGRCVKADVYKSACSRARGGRLVTMIADELQLIATRGSGRHDDAKALPLLREYRTGVVAGTQSLASLDKAIGSENRRLLLANFNSIAFMRSIEPELAAFAEQVCGTTETSVTIREKIQDDGVGAELWPARQRRVTARVRRPVCPRGALARLQPGQAYILRQDGELCQHPIWLAQDE